MPLNLATYLQAAQAERHAHAARELLKCVALVAHAGQPRRLVDHHVLLVAEQHTAWPAVLRSGAIHLASKPDAPVGAVAGGVALRPGMHPDIIAGGHCCHCGRHCQLKGADPVDMVKTLLGNAHVNRPKLQKLQSTGSSGRQLFLWRMNI
ncbi:hypothetical protein Vafri_11745 [Volvox africanus]|uniref:Uncharacterized protein n=1 Tax=Volvox africanus TaxID=51714 RepID=A0A8J4B8J7_9CHLO|nr:hypothetical protein Vafri_11745 [Volvox africanus]